MVKNLEIMWKVLIFVLFVLYIVYLAMSLGQAFGILVFTRRKITVGRMLIPFYYWFASSSEKPQSNKK